MDEKRAGDENLDPLFSEDKDGSRYVWFHFKSSGLTYEYQPAWKFAKSDKFVEALENAPQTGDVAWWQTIMGIYDPHLHQPNADSKYKINIRTAFGDRSYQELEKENGPVLWFRHKDSIVSKKDPQKKSSGLFGFFKKKKDSV